MKSTVSVLILLCLSAVVAAGEVEIVEARALSTAPGVYRFEVTLRHADTGWEHYADGWQVVNPDGQVLAERVLYHPHVDEQPFTRSLSGVGVASGTRSVTIRAHDKVHGYGRKPFVVELF